MEISSLTHTHTKPLDHQTHPVDPVATLKPDHPPREQGAARTVDPEFIKRDHVRRARGNDDLGSVIP
jgi:hypothetical protein